MPIKAQIERAKWSVMWTKNGEVYEKKFDDELSEAVAFYDKIKRSSRKNVTLRSCNVGFPAPLKYIEHPVQRERTVWVISKRTGRKRQVRKMVTVHINIMGQLNKRGFWWCPYCQKLRKFVRIRDELNPRRRRYECPLCGISHEDFHVKKNNPLAMHIATGERTRRRARVRRSRTQ